ncbi:MAG: aconitase X swivel domain-containing protein [Ignavibacteriales bacterium]
MSQATQLQFDCHPICGGIAEGEALVSTDDICFYLTDPQTGMVIEDEHCLKGQSVAGKILVFPSGKGSSVVQADGLYQLMMKNNAPKALLVERPDTVLVATAIIMEVPMVDRVSAGFYSAVKSGDRVKVDANSGVIEIVRE